MLINQNESFWNGIFGKDVKLCISPELPKVEFKMKNIKYSVTDIRLLDKTAVSCLYIILEKCLEERDVVQVPIVFPDKIDDETRRIISDILLGIKWKATKGGKNGFNGYGNFLITGIRTLTRTMIFETNVDEANFIHDYMQQKIKSGQNVNLYEMIAESAYNSMVKIGKWAEQND